MMFYFEMQGENSRKLVRVMEGISVRGANATNTTMVHGVSIARSARPIKIVVFKGNV